MIPLEADDDLWKEPPTAYYSESGERFGTPQEMMAEIRRLRLRLALATSSVTPWRDKWTEWSPHNAAVFVSVHNDPNIRLGDGMPEPL